VHGDPDSQEEVGDCVSRNCISQAVFSDNQTLIGECAEDSGKPFQVANAEDYACNQERTPLQKTEGNFLKIGFDEVSVNKRPVEHFFERRNNQ